MIEKNQNIKRFTIKTADKIEISRYGEYLIIKKESRNENIII